MLQQNIQKTFLLKRTDRNYEVIDGQIDNLKVQIPQ